MYNRWDRRVVPGGQLAPFESAKENFVAVGGTPCMSEESWLREDCNNNTTFHVKTVHICVVSLSKNCPGVWLGEEGLRRGGCNGLTLAVNYRWKGGINETFSCWLEMKATDPVMAALVTRNMCNLCIDVLSRVFKNFMHLLTRSVND